YGDAGLWDDANNWLKSIVEVAELAPAPGRAKGQVSPMVYYYLASFSDAGGKPKEAAEYRKMAMKMSPEYCFPFQWEAIGALRSAINANPSDDRATYFLGNLLFDWQPEEAVKLWKQSAALDPSFAMGHRNLALAYSHQKPTPDTTLAIAELEQAVAGPTKYAMHFS